MKPSDVSEAFRILRRRRKSWEPASVTEVAEKSGRDPYLVLVSCLISLRTKDEVTAQSSQRLFRLADTPDKMLRLPARKIAETIYPAGFYRKKAETLQEISRDLLERYGGKVPDRIEDLLTLNGVGRKTANLVVTMGHGKPGICVDTHVHRITNRWGLVETRNPEQTEFALREILPQRYWIPVNDLLVGYGKRICQPVSPHCSLCELAGLCDRVGVGRSR